MFKDISPRKTDRGEIPGREPFWLSYLLLKQAAQPQSLRDYPLLIFILPLFFANDPKDVHCKFIIGDYFGGCSLPFIYY